MFRKLSVLALLVLALSPAAVAGIIFDNSGGSSAGALQYDGGYGAGTLVSEVSSTVTITGFSILSRFLPRNGVTEGSIYFSIFDYPTHNRLYNSARVHSVGDSYEWHGSNPMSFTLTAGQQYVFAVLPTGIDGIYPYLTGSYSENGITTSGNVESYAYSVSTQGPQFYFTVGAGMLQMRLETAETVPEPTTLALLSVAAAGFAVLRVRSTRR